MLDSDEPKSNVTQVPYELLGRFIDDYLRSWRADLSTHASVADALSGTGLIDANDPPDRSTVGRWRAGKSRPKKKSLEALTEVLWEGRLDSAITISDIEGAISFLSDTEESLKRWHHRPDVPELAVGYLKEKWPKPASSAPPSSSTTSASSAVVGKRPHRGRLIAVACILVVTLFALMILFQPNGEPLDATAEQAIPQDAPSPQNVSIDGNVDGATINQTIDASKPRIPSQQSSSGDCSPNILTGNGNVSISC